MRQGTLKVLVVEDDDVLRRALARMLVSWKAEVDEATTRAEALYKLSGKPNILILDVSLPDGSGVDVAEAANQIDPTPLCIAISGTASAEEAFKLRDLGVVSYLSKPVTAEEFAQKFDSTLNQTPELASQLKALVGRESFKEVQHLVRTTMVKQALALSRGNLTHTAELLGVSRQAVQHMIKDLGLDPHNFSQGGSK